LPLHTDMTYHRDPPGLQIFTMAQPAISGGESVFGDGFAVAERLRCTNPEAFDVLSTTVRRYRCIDCATGWHLEASGPVISDVNGEVVMIRHNDLDRLPDLPPADCGDADGFYAKLQAAHLAWDQILAEDDMRLVVRLQPGDTIVVANQVSLLLCAAPVVRQVPRLTNLHHTCVAALISYLFQQRCFHGRYSFDASSEAPRAVMGCYVSQDELSSRFRSLGFPSF
jgi:Taurine catabolism dioxygenase TauD, TfdA family